jgi:hypothetical protein
MAIIRVDDETGKEEVVGYRRFLREVQEEYPEPHSVYNQMMSDRREVMCLNATYRYARDEAARCD